MYTEYFWDGAWAVAACDDNDTDYAHLYTTFDSCVQEDCEALSQILHDEFGDANALYEAGVVFDVVAVPDDVGHAAPAVDEIVVLWCDDDAPLREDA